MAKKLMLLVNPNAGKGGYRPALGGIMAHLCSCGWQPTVFFTSRAGEAPELIEANASEYERVICMGGDGTLSEVVSGMMRLEKKCPIGYIPLGTTNDVAKTLGLSVRPVESAKTAAAGTPVPFDVGLLGDRDYFTYIAAFGAFTEVSYETPQDQKRVLGHMAYMLEGIRQLPRITSYHAIVEYDDGVVEGDFLFGAVSNSASVGGLVRLDNTVEDLSDGLFEMLLVKRPQDLADLGDIISSAMSGNFSGENILFFKSSEIRIMFSEPVAWTRDGEDGGKHRDVFIRNCHPAVEIIA